LKRQIQELVTSTSDGWSMVNKWFQESKNTYEILKVNNDNAGNVLFNLQVTTNSPLGAIAYYSGGILVDDGWIRVLGSGHENIFGNLLTWNGLDEGYSLDKIEGAYI
jgi:hypothetical protein